MHVNPSWDIDGNSVVGSDGQRLTLLPHEFWYLAPGRTTFAAQEKNVRPLDFAALLRSAVIGKGLVVSMQTLLAGLPLSSQKRGAGAEAEELLERIRAEEYPNRPSRMRCHYLNADKAIAKRRALTMFRKPPRLLVRCFIVGAGPVHAADMGMYERLEGRPNDVELARRYWEPFLPKSDKEAERLEVLAGTALYFPDWRTFPTVSDDVLITWQTHQHDHG